MSEKEKMIRGEVYNAADPKLVLERAKANRICARYNKKALNAIKTNEEVIAYRGQFLDQATFLL